MGPYTFEVGGDSEIWVPHGDAHVCGDGDEVCIDTTTATDARGRLIGTGVLAVHIPGRIDGDIPMTVTGRLSGRTSEPKAKLQVDAAGPITFHRNGFDIETMLGGHGRFTCRNPLPHGDIFICSGRLKVCGFVLGVFGCLGGGGIRLDLGAVGGPWTLDTQLVTDPDSNAISGSASATLANGVAETYTARGKHSAKTGVAKLGLKSLTPGGNSKISVTHTFAASPATGGAKIRFKLAGQSGEFLVPASP